MHIANLLANILLKKFCKFCKLSDLFVIKIFAYCKFHCKNFALFWNLFCLLFSPNFTLCKFYCKNFALSCNLSLMFLWKNIWNLQILLQKICTTTESLLLSHLRFLYSKFVQSHLVFTLAPSPFPQPFLGCFKGVWLVTKNVRCTYFEKTGSNCK